MKFGPVPLEIALGKILGHNITGQDGRRILSKGKLLQAGDLSRIRAIGREMVYVAELEPGDVDEDTAARRVAAAIAGPGIDLSRVHVGRVNLVSAARGVVRVDADRLVGLNATRGITVATLSSHSVVDQGRMVATVKVIPFAVPETALQAAEADAGEARPLVQVRALKPSRVALILSGSPFAKERVMSGFVPPLQARLDWLGATLTSVAYVSLEDEVGEEQLAASLRSQRAAFVDLVVLAGETAIMDPLDIAPRAVMRAGGQVTVFGAPVDPGNLLMLAYLGDLPVLGAPGCARSRKLNVLDWVLPPLLAGDHLTFEDVVRMGHGGLLEDVPERPMPRWGPS